MPDLIQLYGYDGDPTHDPDKFQEQLNELQNQIAELAMSSSEVIVELKKRIARIEHGLRISAGDTEIELPAENTRKSAVWESWKQKLGGKQAEFIQALLTHGEMSAIQLKIATRSGQQTVYDTINKLNKLGLINKNGGKFSLKEV